MSRTIFALVATFALLVLVACSPTTQEPQKPAPEPVQVTPAPEPITVPDQAPEQVVKVDKLDPTVFDALPDDVQTVLEQSGDRAADGIYYHYRLHNGKTLETAASNDAQVLEKGPVVKMTVYVGRTYDRETYVDEVFLNTAAQTATGYCLSKNICGAEVPVKRNVKYSDYDFIQPLEWLTLIKSPEKLGEETINGRSTFKLSATTPEGDVLLWVDRFSGVPLQAQRGTYTWTYEDVGLGVKDKDLAEPTS